MSRWPDLNPVKRQEPAGLRPVVILSRDVFNRHSGTVIATALTSQPPRAAFPLTLALAASRLPKQSWVKISQIRTLSVEPLGKKTGAVTSRKLDQLIEGLNEIIGGD